MNELPEGYKEIKSVDFIRDKKAFIFINLFATIIFIIMLLIGIIINPTKKLVFDEHFFGFLLFAFILLFIYIILHELIHGYFIRKFSGKKAHYGFTGIFAYAGSESYFNKKDYIIIALSPVVILGIVLLIINLVIPPGYFWIVYFIQINNIAGGVGDYYITYIMSKMPEDTLTQDRGVSMVMYSIL